MQALLILLICLVTLAILAGRYGVDSRDGLDWSPPDQARSRSRRWRAVLADLPYAPAGCHRYPSSYARECRDR